MQIAGRPDSGQWLCNVDSANRAAKGSQQRQENDLNSGILYTVRYMGCVEVLQSMRSLDFNTRTQVTREAISRVCEAVPDAKATMRKRKPPSKELSTVLGKSNLQFAGMKTIMCISVSSLSLMIPDSKQFIANHHMQSVSFASGGDPDTSNYVAYVAKDPVNQRACHILECFDDLARCVINSIGQAFELRFKQYLKNPHAASKPHNESKPAGFALWNVASDQQNHGYYNEIPGKLASPTGLQKARDNEDSVIQRNSNQMIKDGNISQTAHTSPITIYENYSNLHNPTSTGPGKIISPSDLFDDPSYMNTQNPVNPHSSNMMGVSGQGSANVHRDMYNAISQNSTTGKNPVVMPMPATLSSMRKQLMKEIWYCGRMSRQEAEKLLINDGDFLVRESMTTSGQYVLTGLQGGQAKHLLLVDPEGMVRTKDHIFDSVSHLISYHVDNQLPIISSGSELYLKKPV
ncbi:SHC-transforming protein 1-like isoform X2 [Pristis pectinata]|nr:SHC-transforming protein 1-like isoform X2 [Pristis pectinata]XP_051896401.1 SHC-transforming protein 1-like isoform X2 [Pristis pectinata]